MSARLDDLAQNGPGSLVAAYGARSLVLGENVDMWLSSEMATNLENPPDIKGKVLNVLPDLTLQLENHPEPVSPARLNFSK